MASAPAGANRGFRGVQGCKWIFNGYLMLFYGSTKYAILIYFIKFLDQSNNLK
jgi:hypothetical protein